MWEDEDDKQKKKGGHQRKETSPGELQIMMPKICLYAIWRFQTSKLYFIFCSYYTHKKEKPLSI